MPPPHVCPSMGALWRPASCDVVARINRCSRGFHVSARRLEDKPGNASTPPPAAPTNERQPRRVRNANAASRVAGLQFRRPLPQKATLAGGSFTSGQGVRESQETNQNSSAIKYAPKVIQPRNNISRPSAGAPAARGAAPPGTMVRAPSKLRITRNAPGASMGGPNLRGRVAGNRGTGATPKRRQGKEGDKKPKSAHGNEEAKVEDTLSDGMVHQLLRLQRKEWDRVPYTPKYAQDSFEANELIHAGRELFKGEAPPVKIWGPLEKKLGIVGMHNAEAQLEVRRVRTSRNKQRRFGGGNPEEGNIQGETQPSEAKMLEA